MARPWRDGVRVARPSEWCAVQTMNGRVSIIIRWFVSSIGPALFAGYPAVAAISPQQEEQACHNGKPEGCAYKNDQPQRLPHRPFWGSALGFVVHDNGRRLLDRCRLIFFHRTTLAIPAIRNRQPPLLRPKSFDLTYIVVLASFFLKSVFATTSGTKSSRHCYNTRFIDIRFGGLNPD